MTLVLRFEIFMPSDNDEKKNGKLVVVLARTRFSLPHLPFLQFSSLRRKNIHHAQRPWLERTVGRRITLMKKEDRRGRTKVQFE